MNVKHQELKASGVRIELATAAKILLALLVLALILLTPTAATTESFGLDIGKMSIEDSGVWCVYGVICACYAHMVSGIRSREISGRLMAQA